MIGAKYLRITMHDNDYTRYIEYAAELLKNIFEYECLWFDYGVFKISEDDIPALKGLIKHIIYATNNIIHKLDRTQNDCDDFKKFILRSREKKDKRYK